MEKRKKNSQIPKAWMEAEIPWGRGGVAENPKILAGPALPAGNKAATGDKTPRAAVNLFQKWLN